VRQRRLNAVFGNSFKCASENRFGVAGVALEDLRAMSAGNPDSVPANRIEEICL